MGTIKQIDSINSDHISNCQLRLFSLLFALGKQKLDKFFLFTLSKTYCATYTLLLPRAFWKT